ncbi:hypothetical protein [Streptomyces sp. MST-110588]|uniref:hypothetical protein n=1 Tax=Streptomyces sp. MST-110588 TaxID=2833628 RepID=UPI001F5C151F|nr:hypothetical protein [Streptomyces sp. MST-110588]UNO42813.1 hypothetical protein KGS77_28890 [Streptomyces sp. MST-110588]
MSAASGRSDIPTARGLRVRLPWWALALPVVCFGALLALIAAPSQAQAASLSQGLTSLIQFFARLFHLSS